MKKAMYREFHNLHDDPVNQTETATATQEAPAGEAATSASGEGGE